ncbi:MAG: 50S ribosomal protein L23 [Patescibacteria group bacterium]
MALSNLNPFSKKPEEAKPAAIKKKEAKVKKSGSGKSGNEKILAALKSVLRPIVSEKNTMLNALNKYIFEVAPETNRIEVKKGIEVLYNVRVESVNIIPIKKRAVRYGKTSGWTKAGKKAIVTLKKGEKIEVSKGV